LAITAIELAVGEPPHSNVHPMRAIFMIPNSDPPTLPDPAKWSADFNDFLKVCLVKNPEKRPTATQLLQGHPFILKAKGKAIIAQLVDECMQEIDEYRAQEAAEAANAAANPPAVGTGDGSEANGTGDSSIGGGTMSSSYASGTMVNTGTMVHNANDSGTMRSKGASTTVNSSASPSYEAGTMVFNAGTMQQAHEAYNSGTMVLHSSPSAGGAAAAAASPVAAATPAAAKKPPVPSAIEQGGSSGNTGTAGGNRAKYEEPSYMRHIREASSKFGKGATATPGGAGGGGGSNAGTMNAAAATTNVAPAAPASPAPLTPNDFREIYRTSRRFDGSQIEPLSVLEVKQALSVLEKSLSTEKSALETMYSEQKKQLKQALEKAEKREKAAKK
jgi:hypothetical protein